jgi:hypothetical protein
MKQNAGICGAQFWAVLIAAQWRNPLQSGIYTLNKK